MHFNLYLCLLSALQSVPMFVICTSIWICLLYALQSVPMFVICTSICTYVCYLHFNLNLFFICTSICTYVCYVHFNLYLCLLAALLFVPMFVICTSVFTSACYCSCTAVCSTIVCVSCCTVRGSVWLLHFCLFVCCSTVRDSMCLLHFRLSVLPCTVLPCACMWSAKYVWRQYSGWWPISGSNFHKILPLPTICFRQVVDRRKCVQRGGGLMYSASTHRASCGFFASHCNRWLLLKLKTTIVV